MAYLDSPCKGICHSRKFDGVMMCSGCMRYPEEIEGWFDMTDEQRQSILKELPHRNPKQWKLMNPDKEFPDE
ncbi:MAG TPA: DUF1289 domain-containing protein [Rhodospirillaceae bacterium]|nr:DUF1289 domain-containing protein [Rhodospirillaceae bacterium]HAT36320.1 DUF1289 domain-containing protein [Rhodospirillaceae bacterium]|tara:strand:- start:92 stop:307 length:216 start_codon:yes stop_codon:yes gene_type:complete